LKLTANTQLNTKHGPGDKNLCVKALFYSFFITTFKLAFNIFEVQFFGPNLRTINPEHKSAAVMPLRMLLVSCLVFLGYSLDAQENRTFSGYGNNLENRDWGSAHSGVVRMSSVNYKDGVSSINDSELPDPRLISNRLFDQQEFIWDDYNLSDYVWLFGQFIDHDLSLIENNPLETVLLSIPPDDQHFSPSDFIITARNKSMPGTGTSSDNPRQFVNEISSFIDGSAVYGSDEERAQWLRTFENGKLKTSQGNMLPWNTYTGEFDDEIDPDAPFMADDTRLLSRYFVAGDIRANENPLLIGMHTIFVREHNRLCDQLKERYPHWTDDQLYQRARKLVGAYIQNICFNEWLPAMGVHLPEYRYYNEEMNPGILNVFSGAAFRIGHTLINSQLIRMDNEGEELAEGSVRLKDAFFNPFAVMASGGIDPFFKGMGTQVMQKLDCKVIDDLRNFLFGPPGSGGLDLASINIFRGRDRGIADYNQLRFDFGLPLVKSFEDFTASPEDAQALESLYGSVDKVDPWVGMLAERHIDGAIFGDLVMRVMETQFQLLRDGDRFYFENDPAFTDDQIEEIKSIRLYDVVMRNTDLSVMQKNLFFAMPHENIPDGPELTQDPLSAAIFPNPVFDRTTIKLNAEEEGQVLISLFNADGQLLSQETRNVLEGKNFLKIHVEETWPRGLYNILLQSGEQYTVIKMVKE
jgi:peroxidase